MYFIHKKTKKIQIAYSKKRFEYILGASQQCISGWHLLTYTGEATLYSLRDEWQ